MSRIGTIPIQIPDGVTMTVGNRTVTVKGTKGELSQDYYESIVKINLEDKVTDFKKMNKDEDLVTYV